MFYQVKNTPADYNSCSCNAFSLFISILVHCTVTLIKAVNQLRKNTHCGVECCVAFMTQMLGAGEHDADFEPGEISNATVFQPT